MTFHARDLTCVSLAESQETVAWCCGELVRSLVGLQLARVLEHGGRRADGVTTEAAREAVNLDRSRDRMSGQIDT
jgi:hypothetical protein